jgi:ABC-2 type transport system permease protein
VLVGLTTLVLGVAPRMTVAVGATAPLVFYVLELVGPLLDWPDAVVGISPFHHLAAVPVEDYRLGAGLVLLAVAAGLAAAGIAAFERRDLQGA